MGNETDKEDSRTHVKEFLLAEYKYLTDSFWKNEQTGETRVNWFIGVITATAAGLMALLSAQNRPQGEQLRLIIAVSLIALLIFGIVTLYRIKERNKKTDGYKLDCDAIRQIFRDHFDDKQILNDYHPFKAEQFDSDDEEELKGSKYGYFPKRKFGGLTYFVSAINSLIFSALIFIIFCDPESPFRPSSIWMATLAFILAYFIFSMIIESDNYVNKITHAAGIVYRSNGGRIEYLLVGPKEESVDKEWLLPKGHIKKKEDQRETVIREVLEETGVEACLIWPLGKRSFKTSKENITAQYYLMSFVSQKEAIEKRRQDWFTYGDALKELTHKSNKSLLKDAEHIRATYFQNH